MTAQATHFFGEALSIERDDLGDVRDRESSFAWDEPVHAACHANLGQIARFLRSPRRMARNSVRISAQPPWVCRGRICPVPAKTITAQRFRRMALALEGAIESSHMG